jgi:tRNA A-37 threonylcarbamoyl transferase component Bud32
MTLGESASENAVNVVLAAYHQAVDAGQAPNRADFLAQHPEMSDELRAYFADLDQVESLARPLPEVAQPSPPHAGQAMTDTGGNDGRPETRADQVADLGEYELLEEIGRGGMGVVYKARQRGAERLVAVKMILAGQLATPADMHRFEHEARVVARLDHPNIVPLVSFSAEGERHYFSMKLIEGGSLSARIRQFTGRFREIGKLMVSVARAVHYAHQRAILHRDLKPANILLDQQGTPHITDFGLAKAVAGDGCETSAGAILGTASYMAPEQAEGKQNLTTAAHIYALGAILYELLTGRPPFQGANTLDTLRQVVEQEPIRPRLIQPKIPRDLEVICLKCLQKHPALRYPSAEALAEDLEGWLHFRPIKARQTTVVQQAYRWYRRNRAASLAVAAALAVGLALSAFWLKDFLSRPSAERLAVYRDDMGRAQRAFKDADGGKLRRLLDKQRPSCWNWQDPRDEEWYDLDVKAQCFLWRFPARLDSAWFTRYGRVEPCKWSADSQRLAILLVGDISDLAVEIDPQEVKSWTVTNTQTARWASLLVIWDAAGGVQFSTYSLDEKYLGDWDSTGKKIGVSRQPLEPGRPETIVANEPIWSPDRRRFAVLDPVQKAVSVWRPSVND